MKAEAKSLRFLGESPQKLTIPFFQRGYVWKKENWEELLRCLCDKNAKPFLGSIIIKNVGTVNPTEAQVIDGQQRLTTLTLLSKAIYDTLTLDKDKLEGKDPYEEYDDDDDKYGKSELKSFLFYKVNAADPFKKAKVKIEHSKVDREAYECIIKENFIEKTLKYCSNLEVIDLDNNETSPILRCYKFFREQLLNMRIEEIIELHNSMYNDNKKMIVLITMDLDDDNEQSIFDTINRAGVHLSVSDIIKNDIFKKCMDLCEGDSEKQEEVINKYEEKWEKLFYLRKDNERQVWEDIRVFGNQQRTNLDFILYCVAFVKWGKEDDIFSDLANLYKRKTQIMNIEELFELIDNIYVYAQVFKENIIDLQDKYKLDEDAITFKYDDYKNRLLLILEVYGVQMFYPYIVDMLVKKDTLGEEEIKKAFGVIESFVIRRRLSGKSVSDYANKCDTMIKHGLGELIAEIQSKDLGLSNDELDRYLINIKTENAKLILFIIELYKRRSEKHDINSLAYRYTLEHIMPKSWQKNWLNVALLKKDGSKYLSEDGNPIEITSDEGQKIRKHHIESLGNMTLLSQNLNASIKNNTYEKKINGEGDKKPGYRKYTSLYITKELVEDFDKGNVEWNEATIEKRTRDLKEIMIQIWPEKF